MMKRKPNGICTRLLLLSLFSLLTVSIAPAQTTTFTYQGRLTDGGTAPASAIFDMQFKLFDAISAGTQQPQPNPITITNSTVQVTNGVFTMQLDFGGDAFPGADRYLEISIR